jgi:hypothetical protein
MGVLGAGHVGVSMRATVAGIAVRAGRKRPGMYSTSDSAAVALRPSVQLRPTMRTR